MKKLIVIALVIGLIGCSKDAENEMSEISNSNENIEASASGSFDLGIVESNGDLTITYDMTELQELTSCAVSEGTSSNLSIIEENGAGYYLVGEGSSTNSHTTFAIYLDEYEGVLSWSDNAPIFKCTSDGTDNCSLDIIDYETFVCSNSGNTCVEGTEGGGASYGNPCNWPWLVGNKDK